MKYALILPTLPAFVLGYCYVLLATVLFMCKDLSFDREMWTLSATWRPWVAKRWKYSTTLSYGIIFQPGVDKRIQEHEKVHVRQVQDLCTLAFMLGLSSAPVDPYLGLGLWLTGPIYQLPNFLTAVLRGGHVYRSEKGIIGPEHERSAYAQTNVPPFRGSGARLVSWLDSQNAL